MENPFPAETTSPASSASDTVAQARHSHGEEALPLQTENPEPSLSADQEITSLPLSDPLTLPARDERAIANEAVHANSESLRLQDSAVDSQSDGHPALDPGAAISETAPEAGSLEDYASRASRARLKTEEETEATLVLKEALLGGRTDVARAVLATPFLPWVVSVQATSSAWPEMKPSFRAQFLAGLARTDGEQAARVRLSLARGLFKVDQAAAMKLILLTLKLLRNKQTGLLEGKGPALFANVLIGRGKAWALQLPLAELKPLDADLLVFAALHGAFHAPQAPVAQLSILKWAAAGDRLTRLPEALAALILKGVARWSAKWQSALRKEVSPVPESWLDALKAPASRTGNSPSRRSSSLNDSDVSTSEDDAPEGEGKEGADSERSGLAGEAEEASNGDELNTARNLTEDRDEDEDEDEDDEDDDSDAAGGETDAPEARSNKPRPAYVSRTVPGNGGTNHQAGNQGRRGNALQHFNLQDSLRQIDNYVAGLRSELQAAQKQLRQRDDDPRRGRRGERPAAPVAIPGELSAEELLRVNQQLESRNAELKTRIDELTVDSEERAASVGLITDAPTPDAAEQLRTILGFKLKDDFEDFIALQQEARDLVVQQHYRSVLQHVFEVLVAEGVQLPNMGQPPSQ